MLRFCSNIVLLKNTGNIQPLMALCCRSDELTELCKDL